MILRPAPLAGAFIVEIEPVADERGFFARTWCRREFAAAGIDLDIVQSSLSQSRLAGTLRGLHFQWPPSREAKLIRCQRGRIHDVLVDLRPASRTYRESFALTLDAERHNALFCPSGVAHGFQTLTPDSEVLYLMTDYYRPELYAGVRYDDPAFAVAWPLAVSAIHERDRSYPDFDPAAHAQRFAAAQADSNANSAANG